MARKKSLAITGMVAEPENKLIVQKTRPLFSLWQSDYSLAEFKILDTYLARINSQDPDHRTVRLTKGQLEAALGVKKINKADLTTRLRHLYQPIDLSDGARKIHLVSLFEEAYAEQDANGIWQISLTCTPSAMKYIFHADKIGYLRYKLRCVTSLTSRYSYILFCYLEDNRFRRSWDVDLMTLRKILDCHEDPSYDIFKAFNQKILNRCHQELTEKTECRFTYTPIRVGRKVTAIHFEVEPMPKIEPPAPDPEQLDLFHESDDLILLRSAVPGFSEKEFDAIYQALVLIPEVKLPLVPHIEDQDITLRRYHFLAQKYATFEAVNERKKVRHRLPYFLKMLEEAAQ